MKLVALNCILALVVLGAVAYGVQDMRRSAYCANKAITIIEGFQHHVPTATLDTVINQFWMEC